MTDSNENLGSTDTGSAMAWGTTAFEPGDHVGLVARRTIALIAGDNPSTRARLWALVSADTPVDDILEELSSTGIKALPDFGVVQVEGDGVRVVARGAASVSIELSSGEDHEIDATDVRTWVEDHIDDVVSVTMSIDGEGDAGDSGFAVLAGSVPASLLTRRFDEADAHAIDGEQWSAAPVAPAAPAAPVEPAPSSTPAPPVIAAAAGAPIVAAASTPAPIADDTDQAEPSLDAAPEVELEPVDDISGAGEMTSVEPSTGAMASIDSDHIPDDAESAPDADADAEADADADDVLEVPSFVTTSAPDAPAPAPAGDTAALWGDAAPTPSDDADDAIDESGEADSSASYPQPPPPAPNAAPSSDAPAPPLELADDAGDADAPIAPFDAAADLESSLLADEPDDEPEPLAPFDADELEPVAAAVLAFSNGERIEVDRSVLVGRNPKVTGSIDGPLPYIMKYEGPGQGLSRTHAEIRIEDGALVIEDLRSTNGTDVQPPGEPRRRLVGGEPVVIVPGTLIDFGDELRCMVESPA